MDKPDQRPSVSSEPRAVVVTIGQTSYRFTNRAEVERFALDVTQRLHTAWPPCPECDGKGDVPFDDFDECWVQCNDCGGSGVRGGE